MLKTLPDFFGVSKPEYLFITGDLRYGKECKKGFPAEISTDIKRLMESCRISPENTHIVMGNHDVVQDFGRNAVAPLLRQDYEANGCLNDEHMRTLKLSHHGFNEIYESICDRKPVTYHTVFRKKNFNIICLNTAFASSGDNAEEGKLIVGMELVQKALKDIGDTSKPCIALAHHGFSSLSLKERKQLKIKLQECGVILYLCGHEHQADCREVSERHNKQPLIECVCGTGMDKLSDKQPATMVVFFGELNTIENSGFIRALEWIPSDLAWMPYRSISYKQTGIEDGRYYFPSPPRQKTITVDQRNEAMAKYREYLSIMCGEIPLDGMPADGKVGDKSIELEKMFIPTRFMADEEDSWKNFTLPLLPSFSSMSYFSYKEFIDRIEEIKNLSSIIIQPI